MTCYIIWCKPLLNINNNTGFNIVNTRRQRVLEKTPSICHFLFVLTCLLSIGYIIDNCKVTTETGHAISVLRVQFSSTIIFQHISGIADEMKIVSEKELELLRVHKLLSFAVHIFRQAKRMRDRSSLNRI